MFYKVKLFVLGLPVMMGTRTEVIEADTQEQAEQRADDWYVSDGWGVLDSVPCTKDGEELDENEVKADPEQVKKLFNQYFEEYKKDNPDWEEYFSDSTYYEIADWYDSKHGTNFEDVASKEAIEFATYVWENILMQ
jgi:hypothetical protein